MKASEVTEKPVAGTFDLFRTYLVRSDRSMMDSISFYSSSKINAGLGNSNLRVNISTSVDFPTLSDKGPLAFLTIFHHRLEYLPFTA